MFDLIGPDKIDEKGFHKLLYWCLGWEKIRVANLGHTCIRLRWGGRVLAFKGLWGGALWAGGIR